MSGSADDDPADAAGGEDGRGSDAAAVEKAGEDGRGPDAAATEKTGEEPAGGPDGAEDDVLPQEETTPIRLPPNRVRNSAQTTYLNSEARGEVVHVGVDDLACRMVGFLPTVAGAIGRSGVAARQRAGLRPRP